MPLTLYYLIVSIPVFNIQIRVKIMSYPHVSVLLEEFLSFYKDRQIRYFVDGTLGAAGHAFALLEAHPEIELFIGIDQDNTALEIAKTRLEKWKDKILLIKGNFEDLKDHLEKKQISFVDGLLFDLGVSSMQFDIPEKGFSFMHDGPLDMRMNGDALLTAEEIVNQWSEQEIGRVFREYGEEKQWRLAARSIVKAREEKPIKTTKELATVLNPLFSWKKKGINPLTLIFQGLRIAVNRELSVLEKMLPQALDCLNKGGRLSVISFHSLEDRIVKNVFRYAADDKESTSGIGGVFLDKKPTVELLTRKPVVPTEEEIQANPRSRSAKLRVVEKL